MKLQSNKKLTAILLLGAVVIAVAFALWYYKFPSFLRNKDWNVSETGGSKDCLILLPEEYCRTGTMITYLDHEAVGFNLPEGTEIYAPFDGAFFEDDVLDDRKDELVFFTQPIRVRFGIPNTSSFVVFVGFHSPIIESGRGVSAGETVATFTALEEPFNEEIDSNFIVYTIDYDLNSLFR